MKKDEIKNTLLFTYNSLSSFKLPIFIMILNSIIWAIDTSLRPYILKIITNNIASSKPGEILEVVLWPIIAYFVMALLVVTMLRLYSYFVTIVMTPNLRKQINKLVFNHVLKHSHNYFLNNFAGSLASKINDLTSSVPTLLTLIIDRFFSNILAIMIVSFTLWKVHIKYSLIILTWILGVVIASYLTSEKTRNLADDWFNKVSKIFGFLVDALSNALSIKLFANAKFEEDRINEKYSECSEAESKFQFLKFKTWVLYDYTFIIVQIICVYLLIIDLQHQLVTVGDFILVLSILSTIVGFVGQFTKDFTEFSFNLGKMNQALRMIYVPIEIQDNRDAPQLVVSRGKIIFDSIKFHYKTDTPLFENLSIQFDAGQKIGLVGYSGCGKTTFVNLIIRLFEVNQGRILIDDQNIVDVSQDSLHKNISVIPQDTLLFHRSLMENIRYGRIDATDEEVIEAAKYAHAHEFISKLTDGYDSLVGEKGIKLSGGQRQCIAIARAFLKNAPILILDEATSALDSATEHIIQHSLSKLIEGKTVIVIAHRLSTLLNMDRIIVLDKGKIIQDGNHYELINSMGLYKTLWDVQVGGFLPEKKKEVG